MDSTTDTPLIIVAGATGELGGLIAHALRDRGAGVRALVRPGTESSRLADLRARGVEIREVSLESVPDLTKACSGAHCVVSALSGLGEVIIDLQTNLLKATEQAGVKRFIPSDYSLDFTRLPRGTNRNLDFRMTFQEIADASGLEVTSVLNGMFTDLLKGDAPLIVKPISRVVYWGDVGQPMDMTSMRDTAAYTARVAMDSSTPRWLRIAGEVVDAEGLRRAASAAYGKDFKTLRVGGIGVLSTMIDLTRLLLPKREEVFPPWQGMQYMRNMLSGRGKHPSLDNNRYPDLDWESVRAVLVGDSAGSRN
ncbi:nucleoside-diphosphate-sugar epimerase [Neolewinella xylanilytica]|uniref:Nucleoside-diphosphate-sugar epimerase n=1 Tax=Neolewinella xylanilytica TaxID=1514080 RepID=A0A2S6I5E8_9BACT|nr:NmrA family NAD(P)-binding protein [Neolewinella xylanilytica]PPK86372.1 nucleoside-diphosphate-sugar epimerase [Neolewinella xylanilytica]